MRISAKGRYALAVGIELAKYSEEIQNPYITVLHVAETLGISKIYLEQIFSAMKKNGILESIKGSNGGYRLAKSREEVSVYDILACVEKGIFEKTSETVKEKQPTLEEVLTENVYFPLDKVIENFLKEISIGTLAKEKQKLDDKDNYMFFI